MPDLLSHELCELETWLFVTSENSPCLGIRPLRQAPSNHGSIFDYEPMTIALPSGVPGLWSTFFMEYLFHAGKATRANFILSSSAERQG